MSWPGFHIEKEKTYTGSIRYFLMGPDDLVWHESWSRGGLLRLRCIELNRAYELGKNAKASENDN